LNLPETCVVWLPPAFHLTAHVIVLFADPPTAASGEVDVSLLYFPLLQELQKPVVVL
jgi:hypothetical protein